MTIRGCFFDLDGTLVDSALDFDLMRQEMQLADGLPLLEAIALLEPLEAARCWSILARHEREGVERATLLPGADRLLEAFKQRGCRLAVFTRNSRDIAQATLDRFSLPIETIASRDDGPPKPDPTALWKICAAWDLAPRDCLVIGDYRFDIEAGRRAGMRTVLFTGAGGPTGLAPGESADFTLESFEALQALWRWIDQIDLESSIKST